MAYYRPLPYPKEIPEETDMKHELLSLILAAACFLLFIFVGFAL